MRRPPTVYLWTHVSVEKWITRTHLHLIRDHARHRGAGCAAAIGGSWLARSGSPMIYRFLPPEAGTLTAQCRV